MEKLLDFCLGISQSIAQFCQISSVTHEFCWEFPMALTNLEISGFFFEKYVLHPPTFWLLHVWIFSAIANCLGSAKFIF